MEEFEGRRDAQLGAYAAIKKQRKDNRQRVDLECVATPEFREKNQAVINGVIAKILDLLDTRVVKGKNSINITYTHESLGYFPPEENTPRSHDNTDSPAWMYWGWIRYILDNELGYTVGEEPIYARSYAVFAGTTYVRESAICENPDKSFSVKL
jgi:hypothetical protein